MIWDLISYEIGAVCGMLGGIGIGYQIAKHKSKKEK